MPSPLVLHHIINCILRHLIDDLLCWVQTNRSRTEDPASKAYRHAKERAANKATEAGIMRRVTKEKQPFAKQIDKQSAVREQGRLGQQLGGWYK